MTIKIYQTKSKMQYRSVLTTRRLFGT